MKYDNFESLENDLKLFEKEAFVNLRRHDTHLLATSKSKGKCMNYKDELVYKNNVSGARIHSRHPTLGG